MTQDTQSDDVSLRLDDSTRQRITKVSIERKKSMNSRQSKVDRKNAVFSAADKWADSKGADMLPPRRASMDKPQKKKPKGAGDEMAMSEHTGQASRESHSSDEDNRKTTKGGKVVKEDDDGGKLGNYFGQMDNTKPLKRRGARTVASMPADSNQEASPTRVKSERRSRSKSPGALKGRTASPGPMKRRTASPGPMKKRSSSPGPMKHPPRRQSSQPTPSKKPFDGSPVKRKSSMRGRAGSTDNGEVGGNGRADRVSKPGDARGNLEKLLGHVDPSNPTKKEGTRSVASAPAISKKESQRRPRRSSRGPLSRRARSIDVDEPLVKDETIESPRRRTRSVDDVPLVDSDEESPKNFSQKLSKKIKSFKKFTGFGNSDKTSATHQSSSSTEPDQTPKRSIRVDPVRSKTKPTRSNSAGPLTNRPGLKKDREDRRAGLSKSKRNNTPEDSGGDGDEDQGRARPPQRAQSMMLHREATRRGKANSLKDLVNYSEAEIHSTSYFASNHVLVNRERMKRGLRPLTRNIAMDELARSNAEKMAETGGVAPIPATYVGNVLRGESIRAIHRSTMQNKEGRERTNLLSPYFQDFGVGTAKSQDGQLYICQLFSERLELTVTDTTSND